MSYGRIMAHGEQVRGISEAEWRKIHGYNEKSQHPRSLAAPTLKVIKRQTFAAETEDIRVVKAPTTRAKVAYSGRRHTTVIHIDGAIESI